MHLQLFVLLFMISANAYDVWDALDGIVSIINGIDNAKPVNVYAEDAHLNIVQLASKYGYPMETHTVSTKDGYILKMHRIPHGNNGKTNRNVIFLMHGIWESSASWVLLGPKKALAYMLADQGFDVWIGNARGNRYTFQHKTLSAQSNEFWNFTWEEIGLYDLPAMIDYILELTRKKALYYVGFSQGTTCFFVMNSMRPEYNNKIIRMYALAPEVFLGNSKHVLVQIFSPASSFFHKTLKLFNILSSSTDFVNRVTPYLCKFLPIRCDSLFWSISGSNHVNESLWTVIDGHEPTGSSTLQFLHYGQLVHSKRFCRYDFGKYENLKKYKQATPPDYNLKAVTTPVVLFYSESDWFSDRRDVEILKTKIRKVANEFYIKKFAHIDFIYADEATTLIYDNIITDIKKLNLLLDTIENVFDPFKHWHNRVHTLSGIVETNNVTSDRR